ncbi:hypothetical protein F9L16_23480 [Agarivorans sp. B2Z047]|uniref:phage regulatory CII family protein n=1 Tax=Agarivorans sp. B2Z047 TaxID=2652721 RepID=UPI00128C58A6|nr:phage regulatory CII family protein [Agarivorans sp. B2Z047]MPW31919.1 hypothetical protein [Agarivorans sp. B2Z047]UQN44857.1 phage regulatory CII family protein [Agarivorans sp. B2Z047]
MTTTHTVTGLGVAWERLGAFFIHAAKLRNERAKSMPKWPIVLRNKLNRDIDLHHLTVDELLDVTRVTNDFTLIIGLLAGLGRTFILIYTTSDSIDLCKKSMRVNKLSGQLAAMQRAEGKRLTERWQFKPSASIKLVNE